MLQLAVAALIAVVLFWIGYKILGGLARGLPEPPPAGEMRKVNIRYRCEICGTEARLTLAADQEPEAPRHCQEDMTLMTPIDDL